MVRECLGLREKYVYREKVYPWKKETVADSSGPEPKRDPYHFEPVEASAVS